MEQITFGILIVSDRCSSGKAEDKTGPELRRLLTDSTTDTAKLLHAKILKESTIPDDVETIKNTLLQWANRVNVILTAGGTGFAPRDVTPEATKMVIEKEAPGVSTAMLVSSLKITPLAPLSRAVCGTRGKTLIINLPGSPKAARECLNSIVQVIPHAVQLLVDDQEKIEKTHKQVQQHSCHHTCGNAPSSAIGLENVAGRQRKSPFPMISVEEAVDLINRTAEPGDTENVKIFEAHGRVLAENIHAKYDLPPFRASVKDGYAVLASEGVGLRKVIGSVCAGNDPSCIKLNLPGNCYRVNTGGPVPSDASAVVQVEDTRLVTKSADGLEEEEIEVLVKPTVGQDIRPIGCDIEKGSLLMTANTRLGSIELGVLAASGNDTVNVYKVPKIGVISTGDELQQPGEPLKLGRVYDSNKITLMMLLKENGYDAEDVGIINDDAEALIDGIVSALKKVDVIVTTGSVSMGDRDMLKPILTKVLKATIHFGRLNMKPGKPTTYATCEFEGRKKYFLCLPGNPVSATVTANLFIFPLLKRLCGDHSKPIVLDTVMTTSYKLDPRPEYARAVLKFGGSNGYPKAYITGNQISSKLSSCKSANALLMLPGITESKSSLSENDVVKAILMNTVQFEAGRDEYVD